MPTVSSSTRQELGAVIKKFKFEELESAVLPVFPELEWKKIKSKLVKNHQSFKTANALQIIEAGIEQREEFDDKILKDRLALLRVIDVSRHYYKKIWYGYELKGKEAADHPSEEDIESQVENCAVEYHMNIICHVVKYDSLIFISIQEKPRKKRAAKPSLPTYFCVPEDESCIFCCKKIILKSYLTTLTAALGYKSCKQIKLFGKSIPSLVKLLRARKEAVAKGDHIKDAPRLRKAPPVHIAMGTDFTQHTHRRDYINKILGENPPTFETLRVKNIDEKWRHKDALEKFPDEVVFTGVEFRSTSIPNLLRNLVYHKILLTPTPVYATNILTLGRNELSVTGANR
ncbi:hypothetical protein TKK_0002433 [Trichogramma kaykai]|uniref:Uncharacterized protein n=1 Tax=Trichogramma kaykai TaxID=54128 RepID=A0ABD2VXK5_9HYME